LEGRDVSTAAERRAARLQRRQLRRLAARKRELFSLLQLSGLLPLAESGNGAASEQRHGLLNQPDQGITRKFTKSTSFGQMPLYFLRKRALDDLIEATELGRVLIHLCQRRGFKTARRNITSSATDNEEFSRVSELWF
jgi:CRISPR-associated endonuclease Csn1